jgi:hypothetical protein
MTKPPGWIRCSSCQGTGYIFSKCGITEEEQRKGITAKMTNEKCLSCNEKGQTELSL